MPTCITMGQGPEGSEGRGANALLSGGPPFHVMAVLSGTRLVRVLCVVMVAPCCTVACVCVGVNLMKSFLAMERLLGSGDTGYARTITFTAKEGDIDVIDLTAN